MPIPLPLSAGFSGKKRMFLRFERKVKCFTQQNFDNIYCVLNEININTFMCVINEDNIRVLLFSKFSITEY
jgi:hypothetical protein